MRDQCLARGFDLFRIFHQVHRQANVAPEFVTDDVQRGLQNTGYSRDSPGFAPEKCVLRAVRTKVIEHCHSAFEKGHVIAERCRLTRSGNIGLCTRQPNIS